MSKKAQPKKQPEMVSKYKITCTKCGTSWRDKRRDQAIEQELAKDPDYLKKYVCRKCKRLAKDLKYQEYVKSITQDAKPEQSAEETTELKVDLTQGHLTKEDLKQFIPTTSETYINRSFSGVKDEKVLDFHYKSKNPLLKNVLFIGETGTGKTALVRHWCAKNKIPYYRVVMNAGTTPEDIIGQMIMGTDGKLRFQYQVLILFMKYGGVFVFDEINAGQKEMLHILNSVTDFERKAIVTQHKGEVIEAVDDFLVVACMNPPAEYDLQEMSKSLKSRFTPYYFDYDEKVDKKVLGADEKELLEFAKTIRLARTNGEIETPLSTRDLVHFKLLRDDLGYNLAKDMLVNKFQNGEKQVVKTQMEVILEKSKVLEDSKEEEAE